MLSIDVSLQVCCRTIDTMHVGRVTEMDEVAAVRVVDCIGVWLCAI